MFSEYLGVGYHDNIRDILRVKPEVLPNDVIDNPMYINSMRLAMTHELFAPIALGQLEMNASNYDIVRRAGAHALAGFLCVYLEEYPIRNWDRVRRKQFQKWRMCLESLNIIHQE